MFQRWWLAVPQVQSRCTITICWVDEGRKEGIDGYTSQCVPSVSQTGLKQLDQRNTRTWVNMALPTVWKSLILDSLNAPLWPGLTCNQSAALGASSGTFGLPITGLHTSPYHSTHPHTSILPGTQSFQSHSSFPDSQNNSTPSLPQKLSIDSILLHSIIWRVGGGGEKGRDLIRGIHTKAWMAAFQYQVASEFLFHLLGGKPVKSVKPYPVIAYCR